MVIKGDYCLASKKDCTTVISSDFKTCAEECDSDKKETAVQMSGGYKLCVVCTGYFTAKTDTAPSTCLTKCPTGYVGVVT